MGLAPSTVKKLTLDLSSYAGGGGPGRKLSKSPENASAKSSLFESNRKQMATDQNMLRDSKHVDMEGTNDVDEGQNNSLMQVSHGSLNKLNKSKPHINSVSREIHFTQTKNRSLSNVGGSLVSATRLGVGS